MKGKICYAVASGVLCCGLLSLKYKWLKVNREVERYRESVLGGVEPCEAGSDAVKIPNTAGLSLLVRVLSRADGVVNNGSGIKFVHKTDSSSNSLRYSLFTERLVELAVPSLKSGGSYDRQLCSKVKQNNTKAICDFCPSCAFLELLTVECKSVCSYFEKEFARCGLTEENSSLCDELGNSKIIQVAEIMGLSWANDKNICFVGIGNCGDNDRSTSAKVREAVQQR